jgi:hypothetical protein
MRIPWSDNDLNYLIKNFPNNFTSDIAKILNRSEKSIITKANKLKLKKTKNHISLSIGLRNKLVGHKWTEIELIDKCTAHMCCRRKKRNIDEVKDIVLKYKILLDFIKNESGTYQYIKKNNLEYLISHLKRI